MRLCQDCPEDACTCTYECGGCGRKSVGKPNHEPPGMCHWDRLLSTERRAAQDRLVVETMRDVAKRVKP